MFIKPMNSIADQLTARIALRDRPDLQEKIGIKVRNTRTAAQKAAPQKAAATRAAKKK